MSLPLVYHHWRRCNAETLSTTLHKATGLARVRIDGKDHYLGRHGSPESHQRYARLISEWQSRQDAPPSVLTVGQLTVLYREHCRQHYRKSGAETSEVSAVKIALRHINGLHRQTPASGFSPKMLKAVRQSMIEARYVRAYIRVDCAVLRPSRFSVASGVTA